MDYFKIRFICFFRSLNCHVSKAGAKISGANVGAKM